MPTYTLAHLAAAAAVLVTAAAALAQQAPPTPKLAPVVVESSQLPPDRTRSEEQAREEIERTPGGVAIVPRQRIEESRAANLKDVLDFVPGVMIRPRFGAADESQLSVRGSGLRNNFHLRGINVLIDGFPYGNADGFSDFESLELLTTKYIEVYKGANALRFGGNASWYTEGSQARPDLFFATSDDGRGFGPRRRVHTSATSIPDHARMAVDGDGRVVIVWEDSTAVRRRVLLRYTADRGRTLSPIHMLSTAIKAYAPDVAVAQDGSFVVAWHEEQFPSVKTVVQTVRLRAPRPR